MMRRAAVLLTVLSTLGLGLSGCGVVKAKAAVAGGLVGKLSGAQGAVVVAPPVIDDAEMMEVILRSKRLSLSLAPLDQDGSIVLWSSKFGTQVSLNDGILIGTRGLGVDLMSAEAPSLAAIKSLAQDYRRTYHYIDGADQMVRKSYTCTTKVGDPDEKYPALNHIVEYCLQDGRSITNDFWFNAAGALAVSRQYVASGTGFAEIAHIRQQK